MKTPFLAGMPELKYRHSTGKEIADQPGSKNCLKKVAVIS